MASQHPSPSDEPFLDRFAARTFRRTLTARRAAFLIAFATLLVTLVAGIGIWLVDDSFDNLGEGLWWAIQTVTTVGYGDIVPASVGGRIIGTLVMLMGIAFLTVVTASISAALVEQARRRSDSAERDALLAQLDRMEAKLAALEARQTQSGPGD